MAWYMDSFTFTFYFSLHISSLFINAILFYAAVVPAADDNDDSDDNSIRNAVSHLTVRSLSYEVKGFLLL
jgi:hypothetical protein